MALTPSAKDFVHLGLTMWQHSVEKPEARAHGLGWCDPDAFIAMTDLVMTYLAAPGMGRPGLDAVFTNQFSGKVKLDEAQWAQVRERVSQYDKIFG